ncbi:MAG: hypothetical protein HOV81_35990 [Kofleriaceae bacterium]|nr:hypothetical protein [Kofleriaceae bacterium]
MDDLTLIDQKDMKLDASQQAAAEHIKNMVLLAADRAVLHTANPNKYPVDAAADSLEQAFVGYFKKRPATKLKALQTKTLASLTSTERAHRLGTLAAVDLAAAKPVFDQALTALHWLTPAPPAPPPGPPPGPSGQTAADDANAAIRCRIRKVTCVDRTDPDIGDDDMIVGGTITNDKGKVTKIGSMTLGEFNEDDRKAKRYTPPKVFATANLAAGVSGSLAASSWPKAYLATIVLCEEDNGGFPDLLNKILETITKAVGSWAAETLGAAAGAAIGTALFPGLGTAVGAAIGALITWIFGSIVSFIKSWWEDDPLPAFTSTCKVNHYRTGAVSTAIQHWDIKGQGGEYKVELDWQVNWPTHFADKLDATINLGNGKAYFFAGSQYARYDLDEDRIDEGYPKAISAGWPGLWNNIDAGVMWPNGKIYFFKGDEYVRFDATTKKMDAGYPKKIKSAWKGLWADGIEAAMIDPTNGKAYFFKGSQYIRYNIKADHADAGYPLPIGPNWHGVTWPKIDTVLTSSLYAYFFRGDSYIRYNLLLDKADSGVRKTDYHWPGL